MALEGYQKKIIFYTYIDLKYKFTSAIQQPLNCGPSSVVIQELDCHNSAVHQLLNGGCFRQSGCPNSAIHPLVNGGILSELSLKTIILYY